MAACSKRDAQNWMLFPDERVYPISSYDLPAKAAFPAFHIIWKLMASQLFLFFFFLFFSFFFFLFIFLFFFSFCVLFCTCTVARSQIG